MIGPLSEAHRQPEQSIPVKLHFMNTIGSAERIQSNTPAQPSEGSATLTLGG
jgi:hypothetical protein